MSTTTMNEALKVTSFYSPVLNSLEIPLETYHMDATLLESDPLTIFRQPSSPEVDAAWRRISPTEPIVISKEDVQKLGKDPNRAAKWPEHLGFGPKACIGRVDVFHQIHSLNGLRQVANWDYYFAAKYPGGFNTAGPKEQLHLIHYIWLLLQNLMCNANVDVYTHFWTDATLNVYPDFNLNHKCRNFDTVLKWQNEQRVSEDIMYELRKLDEYGLAYGMTDEFKQVFSRFSDFQENYSEDVIGPIIG